MNASEHREEKNKIEEGTLYLVATPIGNLSDLSDRAKKVLSEVDFVAAEDTRNRMKLLSLVGISKPMLSYFEHNQRMRGSQIIKRLKEGQSCALITDAGTPAVSDPGQELVKSCIEEGVPVTSVPGCCAAINALVLSGMNTDRFVFEGFLGGNTASKKSRLEELSGEKRTLIFYEAPHRLLDTLSLMAEAFGKDRQVALCREMTKLNEEISRTTLDGALAHYEKVAPRGEYVLILEGKPEKEGLFFEKMTVEEHVAFYEESGLGRMDAMKAAAKDRGVGKGEIYKQIAKK
ncbi:MAG: 16S rRNA (cytidine(1402)-2'-O)-methyltransferase [Clostridia bacterium]|nr:16S rRNA (cytidine(1402)-2'-O)-methyltransferase [Clostridia bacterium]